MSVGIYVKKRGFSAVPAGDFFFFCPFVIPPLTKCQSLDHRHRYCIKDNAMINEIFRMPLGFLGNPEAECENMYNLSETADSVTIEVPIPGLSKENITVKATGNVLMIKTIDKAKEENGRWNKHHGFKKPSFEYHLGIPGGLGEIKAKTKDGILTVEVFKRKPKERIIEIL